MRIAYYKYSILVSIEKKWHSSVAVVAAAAASHEAENVDMCVNMVL